MTLRLETDLESGARTCRTYPSWDRLNLVFQIDTLYKEMQRAELKGRHDFKESKHNFRELIRLGKTLPMCFVCPGARW